MKNIVISGTNFWNPGDDFVRLGIIRIVREIFKQDQLNFLFYNFNADFFPQNKFAGISNMAAQGDLDKYRDFIDAIVIAGLSAGNEIKDLYTWVLDNKLEDRVYLIGAGYENNYVDRFIRTEPERTIFKNARIIIGRTQKTPDLIKAMDVPYHYINCPAILSVKDVKQIPPGKVLRRIGFSIQLPPNEGITNHTCSGAMYALAIEALTTLMKEYEIEVVAHHKYEYFHFLNLFHQHKLSIPVLFSSFFEDLFDIYPRYDCVITTRLHASLFANGYGIPGIILNDTDRHTHCLENFPHSVWVNNKKQLNEEFTKVLQCDLNRIARESEEFKHTLLDHYIEVLAESFGITLHDPQCHTMPVHFFTIVLNGQPFIRYHIDVFTKLPFKWHWHIIEGVANLVHDTSWSVQNGGKITHEIHRDGRSNDGTSEYLNELARQYPDHITLYRKTPGTFWEGKLEMVNAPLARINEECLLFQIDADELWTVSQLKKAYMMFVNHPEKTAAYYFCHYFVGEDLVTTTRNTYGNHTGFEWLRTWRYEPGYRWMSHEPPRLCRIDGEGKVEDCATVDPFTQSDTEKEGLIFQHYAYVIKEQLCFKEIYYGYARALDKWYALQAQQEFPVILRNFFPWVTDTAAVNTLQSQHIYPLAIKDITGQWRFRHCESRCDEVASIAWVRTDSIGDAILAASMLPYVRSIYKNAILTVICQDLAAQCYMHSPCIDRIITFNRSRLINDNSYREQIMKRLAVLDADLVLNSIYSRDAVADFMSKYSGGKEKVAFKGDLLNYYESIDMKDKNDTLYTNLFSSDAEHVPELKRHQEFLHFLDIQADSIDPLIWTSEADKEYADAMLKKEGIENKKIIALFPGARHFHKEYNNYNAVLKEFSDFSLLILGGREVYQRGEEICRYYPGRSLNLSGRTTIPQMAEILRRCTVYLGSDSAGAHIACAVNTPNVVILGGGHFGRFIPYSPLTSAVCLPLACYRCNWRCPYKRVHCIQSIVPEIIIQALTHTLDGESAKPRVYIQSNNFKEACEELPLWHWDDDLLQHNNVDIIPVGWSSDLAETEDEKGKLMNDLTASLSQGNYDEALHSIRAYLKRVPDYCPPARVGSNLEKADISENHTMI
ncbi:MAG: glycosyltransferase family 9 protein [bacterium]